jgi:F-type H+-transporting ATPase subunit gamma
MPTFDELRRRIESAETLESVVKTMKALAASSVNQFERALASLDDYNTSVTMGLRVVLPHVPSRLVHEGDAAGGPDVVVFGSDQGMCGQFNERVAAFAADHVRQMNDAGPPPRILGVGTRAVHAMEDLGLTVEEYFAVPTSAEGISPAVQDLLLRLEAWQTSQQMRRIVLIHNQPAGAVGSRPHLRQLLPLDAQWLRELLAEPWPARGLPTFPSHWSTLLPALIQEYIFVGLCTAYAESLAAENVSRLASMQAAEKNIEEHLDELNAHYHQVRQSSVTEELLDIAAGYMALTRRRV